MKLLYFSTQSNTPSLGVVTSKGIIDIDSFQQFNGQPIFSNNNLSLDDLNFIKQIVMHENIPAHFFLEESKLKIFSCTPFPSKIICIGLNYCQHAVESNMAIPTIPVVFTKYSNTLINYQQDVSLGKVGEQFDYEVELGIVIGKTCKNILKESALEYVLGYCVANDLSCRDLQFRSSQWLMGKSLDNFLPMGNLLLQQMK